MTKEALNIHKVLHDHHCVCVCVCVCVCAHARAHTHTHKHILTKHTLVCHETITFAEKQTRTKRLMEQDVKEHKNYVTHV